MRVRAAVVLTFLVVIVAAASTGCQRSIFRQYEYEEEIYLKLDGTATIYVNASIPALVALRGLDVDPAPAARVDRDKIRAFYDSSNTHVVRVGQPWRRSGRRFVQVRIDVDDIGQLARSRAFDWSTYRFTLANQEYHYRQTWGAVSGTPPKDVNWDGTEVVAVRMHLPSRVVFHNTTTRKVDRGNIVAWEQPLSERLRSQPLDMDVRMQTQSILYRTLTVFGLALVAALILMAAVVVWIKRKGKAAVAEAPSASTGTGGA